MLKHSYVLLYRLQKKQTCHLRWSFETVTFVIALCRNQAKKWRTLPGTLWSQIFDSIASQQRPARRSPTITGTAGRDDGKEGLLSVGEPIES